ncbi:LysR family transcriptional regulator [Paraburkholderia sp. LEh10]|uniref:LysR family transcriptional regulator n=1 Tax=Paraburkholderia sp. LEh10 TaxID=2821353 RepID=UPI001AE79C0A|nr:LysR family transcriptional regulator [Paraburkholderia sp. LEh10]MBP0590008.1 LysR family transcriptional regulator [Paraburkholderia sp. LEh10]
MDRLSAMETFVAVVEAGSFSAGARRLDVGQPAVSKSIAQLEDRLGVRLLIRSTRGLTPTEAGQQFYERARRAIEEADEAELAARGSAAGLSGRLRVCAAVTFARINLIPRMREFLDAHPDLNVDVILDDRNIDLLEAGIDVALRMGTLGDSSMTARKIAQSGRFVLGTPAYFGAHGTPKTPADLLEHEAIIYDQRGGGSGWSFRRGSSETAVAVSGRMRVSAAEGVRAAVLAGMGVAVASEWMFAPELASGEVKAVLKEWSLPPVDLWAVFPTGRMASAKARAFVQFVEHVLGTSYDAAHVRARAAPAATARRRAR